MPYPFKSVHSESETNHQVPEPTSVETFDGKLHIEWDPQARVTPLGQLPYFIQFLKLGGRFEPWINECPLHYKSNNAPDKIDVLGSLFLSILSGHNRYAHITHLMSEQVNSKLLGMNKVVSDDSARRALHKMNEELGVSWLQKHLQSCYEPLLKTPWILDADITVKPLYGHQEGAEIGYSPQKPGRPSQTYHTYMIANLRVVLDVEVQAGNQSHSNDSLPGLLSLLKRLPADGKPEFVRGDIGYGTDKFMKEMESIEQSYLFKLKKTKNVKGLIDKHHCLGEWGYINKEWEAKEDLLKLQGWEKERRVVIVRRRLFAEQLYGIEYEKNGQKNFAFIDGTENMKAYEYSILVTDLEGDLLSIFHHYRDRADCENNFDEIKNQWGWGGYTTHQIKSCRLMARMIALIYNWWNLYVRLAIPEKHHEAITSRPLLLNGVGRLTQKSRQSKLTITSSHGDIIKLTKVYHRLTQFFNHFKSIATQLSSNECWALILAKAMEKYQLKVSSENIKELPAPA